MHAFELLPSLGSQKSPAAELPDVVGVFGTDASLRTWVIQGLTGASDVVEFDGSTVRWNELGDELATASLFDLGAKRNVVVRAADKFLSAYRGEIESFLKAPSGAARLLLELDSLASNTRIYKALSSDHLLVACGAGIDAKLGVTAAARRKFLTHYLAPRHRARLSGQAADALVEMLGEELGILDTEIAKLALYLEPGGTIDEPLVRDVVAGWQGKTVWQITDAIAAGDAAEALRQLDRLISGGQRPIALLPQIAWSLRRLGMAAAVVQSLEHRQARWTLESALAAAGVQRPHEVSRAAGQLKSLGRGRGLQLLPWLLDADLRLKGTHSVEGRDRFLLEHLVMRLAKSP